MRIRYHRGTLLLDDVPGTRPDPVEAPEVMYDPRAGSWRAHAHHYASLRRRLVAGARTRGAEEPLDLLRLRRVGPMTIPLPSLRPYQQVALETWRLAGGRGVVAMPTGTGKTRVALAAMSELGRPTLILVPTRALLQQWATTIEALVGSGALGADGGPLLGRFGDGRQELRPITVCTFASADLYLARFGDCFPLLVVDEAHHVASGVWRAALEACAAPRRLGLTATPPIAARGRALLEDLVGPTLCHFTLSDFGEEHLAPWRSVTLHVELDADERRRYEQARAPMEAAWLAFRRTWPGRGWSELLRELGRSSEGRRLLALHRVAKAAVLMASAKADLSARILAHHSTERVLVFTARNAAAWALSERLLLPAITCHTSRGERNELLEAFREGRLGALISTRVLNEGIDVPEASVALVLGGEAGRREHVQRVGRVLRPRPGKRAIIYELVVRDSWEERAAFRRALATTPQLEAVRRQDRTP